MKKLILVLSVFATFQAHANTYICLGVDEGDFAKVDTKIDPNLPVKPFGHLNGKELRLIEGKLDSGVNSLSLSIKDIETKKIVSVVIGGDITGFVYSTNSEVSESLNCVLDSKN